MNGNRARFVRIVTCLAVFADTSSLSSPSRKSAYDSSFSDASWSRGFDTLAHRVQAQPLQVLVEAGHLQRRHRAPPRP